MSCPSIQKGDAKVKQKSETAKGFVVFFKVRGIVTCLHSAHKLL